MDAAVFLSMDSLHRPAAHNIGQHKCVFEEEVQDMIQSTVAVCRFTQHRYCVCVLWNMYNLLNMYNYHVFLPIVEFKVH